MKRTQRGITLTGALAGMIVVALVGLTAAQLLPAYNEYWAVKKMLAAMEEGGDLKGTVAEIRRAYGRRNAVEDVKAVTQDDLEITKEGGQTVVSAAWSAKQSLFGNVNLCVDFAVTTAK